MPRVVAVLALMAIWPAQADATERRPYAAIVTTDDAEVVSGPGRNYYPVQRLRAGDSVIVYRHDPGGWMAIQPTDGCFSWVDADYVEVDQEQIGAVIADRVACRVGSSLSDVRDVIQVRLNRAEQVEVLGTQRLGAGPTAQRWYKIAPPSGEFRWMEARFLGPAPPREESIHRELQSAPIGSADAVTFVRVDDRSTISEAGSSGAGRSAIEADTDIPPELPGAREALTRESLATEPKRRDADEPIQHAGPIQRTVAYAETPSTNEPGPDEPDKQDLHDELGARLADTPDRGVLAESRPTESAGKGEEDEPRWEGKQSRPREPRGDGPDEVNIDLTRMVAGESALWDFTELRKRAQRASVAARTADGRERARELLGRIDRFDAILARSRSNVKEPPPAIDSHGDVQDDNAPPAGLRRLDGPMPMLRPLVPAPRPAPSTRTTVQPARAKPNTELARFPASGDPRFDAEGRLAEVVSRQLGDPRYVLLDAAGEPGYYLTPTPGVELQPFLGQRIGVRGTLGYMVERHAQHLSVKSVAAIESPAQR